MRHLPESVNAGIGASGTGEAHRLSGDTAERPLGRLLHRAQRRLRLPAGVATSVVLDSDGNSQPQAPLVSEKCAANLADRRSARKGAGQRTGWQ